MAATPAVRAGFDGPSFTLPAPQVPRRAGESTVLARTPLTRRSCQGSVPRHPAPSNTPVFGQGGCSIGGGPITTKLALRQDSPVADLSEGFGWRPSRRANARSLSPFRWLRKCRESLPPRARPHTTFDLTSGITICTFAVASVDRFTSAIGLMYRKLQRYCVSEADVRRVDASTHARRGHLPRVRADDGSKVADEEPNGEGC